jgi:hypothetical protein
MSPPTLASGSNFPYTFRFVCSSSGDPHSGRHPSISPLPATNPRSPCLMKTTDPTVTHDTQPEKWSPPASAIFHLPAPVPVVSTSTPPQPTASSMASIPVASAQLEFHSGGSGETRSGRDHDREPGQASAGDRPRLPSSSVAPPPIQSSRVKPKLERRFEDDDSWVSFELVCEGDVRAATAIPNGPASKPASAASAAVPIALPSSQDGVRVVASQYNEGEDEHRLVWRTGFQLSIVSSEPAGPRRFPEYGEEYNTMELYTSKLSNDDTTTPKDSHSMDESFSHEDDAERTHGRRRRASSALPCSHSCRDSGIVRGFCPVPVAPAAGDRGCSSFACTPR